MTSSQLRRILFIRLDRIGDLVVTLPIDEGFQSSIAHWWIPKGLSFVTQSASPKRSATEVARKVSLSEFTQLLRQVRKESYDAAVVIHAPWWVSFLVWLARVPLRIGVKSQWHSFLFLNRTVRQKRSRAEASELEYNYLLLEQALRLPNGSLRRHSLRLRGETGASRDQLLARFGLEPMKYSVVHPGMGGSALNWPTERYLELIHALEKTEKVAITGTPADEPYLAPLRTKLQGDERVIWLDGKLKGPELITILANARTITAPSTGVMHLAASTGRPTLGLFSPVRVQQPRRWGPQGKQVTTIMPQVDCPGTMSCLGQECPHYDCMAQITAADACKRLAKFSATTTSATQD